MNIDTAFSPGDQDHFGYETTSIRVLAPGGWPITSGPGWKIVSQDVELVKAVPGDGGDCWLVDGGVAEQIAVDDMARSGLPIVVAAAAANPVLIDLADGFVFADDDAATLGAVFAAATAPAAHFAVRDLSNGTARTINLLSAEAGRIADALARLAEAQAEPLIKRIVDAGLARRILRVRRDRDRYFPAEIFADPAWDMLLDLIAARLEGKQVPVSSLCIAAAVPTTTALRWVRSLTEAGLFERRTDPVDARRSHISLSEQAATAMLAYLRGFADQFAAR